MRKAIITLLSVLLVLLAGCSTGFLEAPQSTETASVENEATSTPTQTPQSATPIQDSDQDGLDDTRERELETDPNNEDTDGDGLTDNQEVQLGSDPTQTDTDGDGLSDRRERELETNFTSTDTDDDGLSDGNEVEQISSDPLVTDTDGDGLSDSREVYSLLTEPDTVDTDDDGLDDGAEIQDYKTNASNPDTDGDGLEDAAEIRTHGTNATNNDTDDDSLTDSAEIQDYQTNATNPDTDDDGLDDRVELRNHDTAPLDNDTDDDGLNDFREVNGETDPRAADTDQDGLPDGVEVDMNSRFPGADPLQKDIYIEVDYTSDLSRNTIRDMEEIFENAPVSNPDGGTGVDAHIYFDDYIRCDDPSGRDTTQRLTYGCSNGGETVTDEDNDGYYYIQIVSTVQDPQRTISLGGLAYREVAFVQYSQEKPTASIFMHELGHLLNIRDPGVDSTSRGYNDYPSVMNYRAPDESLQYAESDWKDINRSMSRIPGTSQSEILNQSDMQE